jgi:hypothetical protein
MAWRTCFALDLRDDGAAVTEPRSKSSTRGVWPELEQKRLRVHHRQWSDRFRVSPRLSNARSFAIVYL